MPNPQTRWTILGITLLLVGVLGVAPVTPQGSISEQVLRLLTRDNYWSGTQTFARTVGVTLESGGAPPGSTDDTLYNLGGALYFDGVLVATSAGAGTVTSVGLSLPALFTVAGSPVTTTGTLTASLATQVANRVWAGPAAGADAAPTFRALVAADIPPISSGSITGTIPVANGGTGLTSGTSGGVLAFTAAGTIASSGALTASRIVLGGGAGAAPTVLGSLGTTTTVLHGNAAGAPSFAAVDLTTTVTGTLPTANGGTGLTGGSSGGIPYFSSTTTIGSSAALAANQIVLGGGAATTPATLGSLGTTSQVLIGNAAGAPSWGSVTLTTMVTGTLPVTNGGTGLATATQGDLLYASAANTYSALTKDTNATRYLSNTGTSNNPAWAQINLANGVTGTLPAANGGTAVTGTPTNGQLLIGNGTGYTLATLTGTASQITVTNGAGTITLSLPQAIATASTPQFARLGLGTGAGATAVITTTGQFNLGLPSANCGAATNVDWNSGQQQSLTLNAASCTLTFANPISGAPRYTLVLVQDGTGGRLVSWPGTILWEGGAAPTLSTAIAAVDVCTFLWNGSAYYGMCTLDFS
jgi:hypothetical protein